MKRNDMFIMEILCEPLNLCDEFLQRHRLRFRLTQREHVHDDNPVTFYEWPHERTEESYLLCISRVDFVILIDLHDLQLDHSVEESFESFESIRHVWQHELSIE